MSDEKPRLNDRLQHAWNVLRNRDPVAPGFSYGVSSSQSKPDRFRPSMGTERAIITSIYTRIAMDVASVSILHVDCDQNGRFLQARDSKLNQCLSLSANMDQTARALMQDVVMSMFDEGCVAIVPTDTTIDPSISDAYDVLALRVAKIIEWYPTAIKVELYNEATGRKEQIIIPKKDVAIIENPLYAVMNEPNSTWKRLIYKLNLLDAIDTQSGSGKLDLIIQLPYVVKSEARRLQAEERRKAVELQLSGSKYGIAYTDGTEKITQLNRPADNNLMAQIEFLTSMLYSQLGVTTAVLDGTADEKTMLNYYNRTNEPILAAICDEMKRKFLTLTARTQHQSIMYFRDPFKLVPVGQIAEIADKLTRNEILSSNEIRAVIGYKPSDDPKANELRNKNINEPVVPSDSKPLV